MSAFAFGHESRMKREEYDFNVPVIWEKKRQKGGLLFEKIYFEDVGLYNVISEHPVLFFYMKKNTSSGRETIKCSGNWKYVILFDRNDSQFIKIVKNRYLLNVSRKYSCELNVFNTNMIRLLTIFSPNDTNTKLSVIAVYQNSYKWM